MRRLAPLVALLTALPLVAAAPTPAALAGLEGDTGELHDPVIARDRGAYYVYGTGVGERQPMSARRSTDLIHWQRLPSPVAAIPDWALMAVPGAKNIWAPDLSRSRDGFRLYYAVSTFGNQRSVIGLMTSPTLDPARPGYGWRDAGEVIGSQPGDDYNAIDPAFVRDRAGGAWLAFGSFWGGLQIVRLDPATGKRTEAAKAPIALARRRVGVGEDAIEAAFIVDHGGWYWLLASWDHCCRGARSDYHVVVGRSRAVTGPYLDRDGRPMLAGGGTDLVPRDPNDPERYKGPGHQGFLHDADGRDFLVFHAYDATARGRPTLRIAQLRWDDGGWPTLAR